MFCGSVTDAELIFERLFTKYGIYIFLVCVLRAALVTCLINQNIKELYIFSLQTILLPELKNKLGNAKKHKSIKGRINFIILL